MVPMSRVHTQVGSPLGRLTLVRDDGALVGLFLEQHRRRPAASWFGDRVDTGFDDAATQTGFLTGVARYVNGVFGFFDGRAPDDVAPTTIGDALYAQNLSEFVAVRRALV